MMFMRMDFHSSEYRQNSVRNVEKFKIAVATRKTFYEILDRPMNVRQSALVESLPFGIFFPCPGVVLVNIQCIVLVNIQCGILHNGCSPRSFIFITAVTLFITFSLQKIRSVTLVAFTPSVFFISLL